MSEQKMSQEQYKAEASRLSGLIQKRSGAGLQAVQELSKHQFSLPQMSRAVKRHHREAAQMWNQRPTIDPDKKDY